VFLELSSVRANQVGFRRFFAVKRTRREHVGSLLKTAVTWCTLRNRLVPHSECDHSTPHLARLIIPISRETRIQVWKMDSQQSTLGIIWMTCGLRNLANPTLDNLKPQETINQADFEVGGAGAGLSCPGSTAVADSNSNNHNWPSRRGHKFPRAGPTHTREKG